MAIRIDGERDPRKLAAEQRVAVIQTIRGRQRGKRVSAMSQAERSDILEALAIAAGLADVDGVVA